MRCPVLLPVTLGVLKGGPASSEVTALAEVHVCLLPSRKEGQESGVTFSFGNHICSQFVH